MATSVLGIGLQPEVKGALKFEGSNNIGPNVIIELPFVQFAPQAAIGFISDAYGVIELEGEVLADPTSGSFGTLTHPDSSLVAPNIEDYYVGTGIVSWLAGGGTSGTYVDLGNVNLFEVHPVIERLDHWNHRVGIRRKDFSPVVQQACTVRLTMDEFTAQNLQMALLADNTPGT